jgi:hypothetical protein
LGRTKRKIKKEIRHTEGKPILQVCEPNVSNSTFTATGFLSGSSVGKQKEGIQVFNIPQHNDI